MVSLAEAPAFFKRLRPVSFSPCTRPPFMWVPRPGGARCHHHRRCVTWHFAGAESPCLRGFNSATPDSSIGHGLQHLIPRSSLRFQGLARPLGCQTLTSRPGGLDLRVDIVEDVETCDFISKSGLESTATAADSGMCGSLRWTKPRGQSLSRGCRFASAASSVCSSDRLQRLKSCCRVSWISRRHYYLIDTLRRWRLAGFARCRLQSDKSLSTGWPPRRATRAHWTHFPSTSDHNMSCERYMQVRRPILATW